MTDDLRLRYESSVRQLANLAEMFQISGASSEEIARMMHAERRSLAKSFKNQTEEPLRSRIIDRTLAVYGDPWGPTIEYLRAAGRSWEQIIDGASRPGVLPT